MNKKTYLSFVCMIGLSACTVDQITGLGAEILIPDSVTAKVSQVKRQSGLEFIDKTKGINQAYFKQHEKEISNLLVDIEYYRIMGYVLSVRGSSLTTPIVQIDQQIADVQQQKRNYRAPKTYEQCIRGADVYNGYGYLGRECYESITQQYTEVWRQQETQRAMNNFNSQLNNLQQQRNALVQNARNAGADGAILQRIKNAQNIRNNLQQKLNNHCSHLLKEPVVKFLLVADSDNVGYHSRPDKVISEVTATRGKDNCAFTVYAGYYPNSDKYLDKTAHEKFFNEYGHKLGIKNENQRNQLIKDSRKKY